MSSLQKFHRRTNGGVKLPPVLGSEAPVAGAGFYLGLAGDGTSYMYVAPKSSEVTRAWGSGGTVRGTTSTTNGLANTNTLAGFGETAHPAAYYCKNLTTGGYNTWYLPARVELSTLNANKAVQPFASANGFVMTGMGGYHWASTEAAYQPGTYAVGMYMNNGYVYDAKSKGNIYTVRAVRRAI